MGAFIQSFVILIWSIFWLYPVALWAEDSDTDNTTEKELQHLPDAKQLSDQEIRAKLEALEDRTSKMGNNSLGEAAKKVNFANCGSAQGSYMCKRSAYELESISNWSDYSDYALYGSAAAAILPQVLMDTKKQSTLKTASIIQKVGAAGTAASAGVDAYVGMSAHTKIKILETVRKQQLQRCNGKKNSADPVCQSFGKGKDLEKAIGKLKASVRNHYIMAGGKTLGAGAIYYLSEQNRKRAEEMKSLEEVDNSATATSDAPGVPFLAPVATDPIGGRIGFGGPTTGGSITVTDPTASSSFGTDNTGGSQALNRKSAKAIQDNIDRQKTGGFGAAGAAGGGSTGGTGGASLAALATEESETPENPEETVSGSWSGAYGDMNDSFAADSGDGGFANMLGAALGGGAKANAGGVVGFGNSNKKRSIASFGKKNSLSSATDKDTNLFQRVSHTINRHESAGNVFYGKQTNI